MRHNKSSLARFADEISANLRRRHYDEQFLEDLNIFERYGRSIEQPLDAFLRTAMNLYMLNVGVIATRHKIDAYFIEYNNQN